MYNLAAFLYEKIAAFEEPEDVCRQLHSRLLRHGLEPEGVLGDLGSGTGLMSILLAEQGWRVYGIELSPAMLSIANSKAPELPTMIRNRITWTQGDITCFELPSEMYLDGAVCLHNTINHLVEQPLVEEFLKATFQAFKPNGILILDSDTLMTFEQFFNHGPVVVWDDGMHRLTRTCLFESSSARAYHTARLEKRSGQEWIVVDEESMQLQYHREPELMSIIQAIGFQVEEVEPYNPNSRLYQGDFIPKLLWTLRKPAITSEA